MIQPDNEENRKKLNDYAREEFICEILQHIFFDINVCGIEGWNDDYLIEFPKKIKNEVDRIIYEYRKKHIF